MKEHFQANPNVIYRKLSPSLHLLINPENNSITQVNDSGMIIWRQIVKKRSIKDIAKRLSSYYCIQKSIINRDILKFLGFLEKDRFIERK